MVDARGILIREACACVEPNADAAPAVCETCGGGVTADVLKNALQSFSKMMSTLDHVPGFRTVQGFGVVSATNSDSGWTAKVKAQRAFDWAVQTLRAETRALGGNAVVGLSLSSFGAQGGITNMIGGDAVGVILLGTAVWVERE